MNFFIFLVIIAVSLGFPQFDNNQEEPWWLQEGWQQGPQQQQQQQQSQPPQQPQLPQSQPQQPLQQAVTPAAATNTTPGAEKYSSHYIAITNLVALIFEYL